MEQQPIQPQREWDDKPVSKEAVSSYLELLRKCCG